MQSIIESDWQPQQRGFYLNWIFFGGILNGFLLKNMIEICILYFWFSIRNTNDVILSTQCLEYNTREKRTIFVG